MSARKHTARAAENRPAEKSLPNSPIAVIIACYNSVNFVREAIESCLNQTSPPKQIIVVDDACTDGSTRILNEYGRSGRILVLRNEQNLGKGRSIDRALELVTAKYVALLDGDDVAMPRRFERQAAFMEAHPAVGCSSSFVYYINTQGGKIANGTLDLLSTADFQRYMDMQEAIGLYCPAVILRTEVIKNPALRFRAQFWPADDIDLWNRISEAGWQVLAQPEFLTAYRIHRSSAVSSNARKARLQYEWARTCFRARRDGLPEPTREEFLAARNRLPWFSKFNRWRKGEAKVAYREAGFASGERRKLKALACLAKAASLQPLYVGRRLIRQLLQR